MARNDTTLSVKHGVVTACDPSAVEAQVPEGVEDVGFMAFADCGSLTKVTLPESLRYIGSAAFLNCTALSDIRFRGTRARWNVVRKSADWNEGIPARTVRCKDGAVLIGHAALEDGTAEDIRRTAREAAIPEGVTEIGMEAFMGFEALESVAIPESVRTISCMAFKDCERLASVALPSGVRYVGEQAFAGCRSLRSLAIAEGIREIDEWAFVDCAALAEVTLPASLRGIGEYAFLNCTALSDIRFAGTAAQWEDVEKVRGWNRYTAAARVACADGDVLLPPFRVADGILLTWYRGVREAEVPAGVRAVGDLAFDGCASLASVTLPAGVTKIGWRAFMDCVLLASVAVPDGVTVIGTEAFCNCRSLASVEIPASVTRIGDSAFSLCMALTDIRFRGTVAQWEAVRKGKYWNSFARAQTVRCTDGEASLSSIR